MDKNACWLSFAQWMFLISFWFPFFWCSLNACFLFHSGQDLGSGDSHSTCVSGMPNCFCLFPTFYMNCLSLHLSKILCYLTDKYIEINFSSKFSLLFAVQFRAFNSFFVVMEWGYLLGLICSLSYLYHLPRHTTFLPKVIKKQLDAMCSFLPWIIHLWLNCVN